MSTEIINIEELGCKIEGMITHGKVKMSDLFIVIGSHEEAEFIQDLGEAFKAQLIENLASKNPELVKFVDTTKIKVFFSRECFKWVNGVPTYTRYVLDHRKFQYPKVSTPTSRPYNSINEVDSHLVH